MPDDADQVRSLVSDLQQGDGNAAKRLLPLIYDDLRAVAGRMLEEQSASHTLQPTALCNEACVRLMGTTTPSWNGMEHLLAVAAIAMRQILVNHAVAKSALKRGGDAKRVALVDIADAHPAPSLVDVLSLDAALKDLESEDAALARVVELRFFAGMTIQQVAMVMGQSERNINRLWRTARAELAVKLPSGGNEP